MNKFQLTPRLILLEQGAAVAGEIYSSLKKPNESGLELLV